MVNFSQNLLPRVSSVGTALPCNYVSQESLFTALHGFWRARGAKLEGFERLNKATNVSGRHLALPIAEYLNLDSFEKSNGTWVRVASALGAEAARSAFSAAGVLAQHIDHIFLVTGTGIATPSIDTRIITALGMRSDLKRTPVFGLGCAGGASGIAHAADYLRAFPNQRVLLIAVELCSLTWQRTDVSLANLIASALFGDGAAAVVLSGGTLNDRVGPQVIASHSVLYPNSQHIMGWQIIDSGFKLVMSPEIPHLIRQYVARDVDNFLAKYDLGRRHIKHWIAHTGGPKVLRSIEAGLELAPSALKRSWDSLCRVGNLSSASVLFVFAELLQANEAKPGEYGLMLALGPGFCLELVLLRW
jgi:alkylresorcinol/alkylpyrone synthase